jgi:hypothetical protein
MFASMEQLTDGLWYERSTASSSHVGVERRPGSGAIEPVLRLRRGAMNGRRVHVDLVLLGGDRAVEVSFHPAATVDLVQGHARRRGSDGNGWTAPLLRAIVEDAGRWGSWTPTGDGPSALAVLGGVTHPLLGAAYDTGTAPAGEIPRWASPALAEATVPAGAVRLFGAHASSRSVARALAVLLARPVIAWWQLALASAMSVVGRPDDVAAVLRAEADSSEPVRLPTAEDRAAMRAGLALLERARAKRLVLDALATDGERGARRLAAALRTLVDAKDDVRWPPPVRLAELETTCLRATAIDPAPSPPTMPLSPPARVDPPARPTAERPPSWATPRRAPAGVRTTGAGRAGEAAFAHPPAARALDRRVVGERNDLELVLPRTPKELQAWGRILGNCLADFAPAVAEHRSVIVGVKERGALVAAVELLPSLQEIRQFLGAGNRVPPSHVVDPVLRHLVPRLAAG